MLAFLQCRQVGRRIHAAALELQHARVGDADVRGHQIGRRTQRFGKGLTRTRNLVSIERLESRATVDEYAMWMENGVESDGRLRRLLALYGREKTVAAPCRRFDVVQAALLIAERLAQT